MTFVLRDGQGRCSKSMKTTYRTPWQKRLDPDSAFYAECPRAGTDSAKMTLTFTSDSDFVYELDCMVWVEYEPAQNGGRHDPSWDAHYHSPSAWWFRPNHGWKELDIDVSDQGATILDHFGDCSEGRDSFGPDPDDYHDSRFDREEARDW